MKKSFYISIILFLIVLIPIVNGYGSIVEIYSSIFSKFFSSLTGRVIGEGDTGGQVPSAYQPTCDNDADGYLSDNFSCGGNDCNDNNTNINPGASEVCDNSDNNCNGQTDEGVTNTCYIQPIIPGSCTSYNQCGLCPTLPSESGNLCGDGLDNDCDGYADCADLSCVGTPSCSGAPPGGSYCQDNDGDGYQNLPSCGTAQDCNDNNPNIHPGATEVECNSIDEDCSGADLCPPDIGGSVGPTSQNCVDLDNDGITNCNGDCNDNDNTIKPGLNELCDAKDNDCDGNIDEGTCTNINLCNNAPDEDGDGFNACADCNDDDSSIHPNRQESCVNAMDDNCNQQINEGCTASCGNILCENGETCLSCVADCGICISGVTGQATITPGLSEEVLIEIARKFNEMRVSLDIVKRNLKSKVGEEGDPALEDTLKIVEGIGNRVEELNNRIAEGTISKSELEANIFQIEIAVQTVRNIIT